MSRPPNRKRSKLFDIQEQCLNNESIVKKISVGQVYQKPDTGGKILGEGGFGKVFLMQRKDNTKKMVAVKQFLVNGQSAREITLHYIAQHSCKGIVQIDGLYINNAPNQSGRNVRTFFCFMEVMDGNLRELCDKRIKERLLKIRGQIFTEREVSVMVRELVAAIKFLHTDLGIAHRDIKLENILYTEGYIPGVRGQLKIGDFGFAKEARDTERAKVLRTACYTPEYRQVS